MGGAIFGRTFWQYLSLTANRFLNLPHTVSGEVFDQVESPEIEFRFKLIKIKLQKWDSKFSIFQKGNKSDPNNQIVIDYCALYISI